MSEVCHIGTDCGLLRTRSDFARGLAEAPVVFGSLLQALQEGNATPHELNQLIFQGFGLAGRSPTLHADWLQGAQVELQARGYGSDVQVESLNVAHNVVKMLGVELRWVEESLHDGSFVLECLGSASPFGGDIPSHLQQHEGVEGLQLIAEIARAYLLHAYLVSTGNNPGDRHQADRLFDDPAYRAATMQYACKTVVCLHRGQDDDDWEAWEGTKVTAEQTKRAWPLVDGQMPGPEQVYCSPFVPYISNCLPKPLRTVVQLRLGAVQGLQIATPDSFVRQPSAAITWRRSPKGGWKVYVPEHATASAVADRALLEQAQRELAASQQRIAALNTRIEGAATPAFLAQPSMPATAFLSMTGPSIPPPLTSVSTAAVLSAAAQAGPTLTPQQRIAAMLAPQAPVAPSAPAAPSAAPPQVQQLPKLPTPPEFKGEMGEAAAQWLRIMQRFWAFNLREYPGHEVTYAIGRLSGDAITWFNSTLGQQYDLAGLTVPSQAFVDSFTARFITPEAANNARNRLYSLRQNKLDIRVFNEKFNSCLTDVRNVPNTDGISHSSAVHAYLQVIQPSLRERMSMSMSDMLNQDLSELQEHAVQCAESAAHMAAYASKAVFAESALPMGARPEQRPKLGKARAGSRRAVAQRERLKPV